MSARPKSRSTASLRSENTTTTDPDNVLTDGRIQMPTTASAVVARDIPVKASTVPADGGNVRMVGNPAGTAGLGGFYDPRSPKFWAIMGCNFLALFLVALDRTILATAVPRITDEFHSLGDVGWYASAYMLTTSASQLLFGRIYKFYQTKWTFLISIIVFEIGSAICGAAPNSTVFIVGRAIAGLGSAGIFTGCMLMFMMVPLHKRPMFQGFFGMIFGLASVMGPLVGGAFTGTITWRWCFYINLPIGALSFVCMILWWNPPVKEVAPAPFATHIKRLDPIGTSFFLPAIVSLLLALQWGGSTYDWHSGVIIGLFVVFAVLILAFGTVQVLKPDTATIPPRIITQRSVFFGTLFTFFIAGSMLMCVYFLPIWFQTAQGVDPLQSGVYTLPLVLSLVVSSAISGAFTARIGYYVPSMLLSPTIMAIGEGLLSTMNSTSNSAHWIAYQFLTGFGLGLGMQTGGLAVQTVLPMADVSTGVAINMFAQQLGGAVFTSVGQAILSNILVSKLTGVGDLRPEDIVKAGITDLLRRVPGEDAGVIVGAYNFACTRIFLAAMGLTFGSLLAAFCMEWRSIKKAQPGSGGPEAAVGTTGHADVPKGKGEDVVAATGGAIPDSAREDPAQEEAKVEGGSASEKESASEGISGEGGGGPGPKPGTLSAPRTMEEARQQDSGGVISTNTKGSSEEAAHDEDGAVLDLERVLTNSSFVTATEDTEVEPSSAGDDGTVVEDEEAVSGPKSVDGDGKTAEETPKGLDAKNQ